MTRVFDLLKRTRGTGHSTTPPTGTRLFTFDDKGRHRKGAISGEAYIKESLLAEFGDPVSIEIIFERE
jgi:hypothetical protein